MKIKITTGVLSLLLGLGITARAEEGRIYILSDGIYYGGYMPECISANGKYVCGSTFAWAGFISDWESDKTKVYLEEDGSSFADYGCDLPFITSEGVALGFDDKGALKIDVNSGELERLRLAGLPDAMTQDGNIIVGMAYNQQLSSYQTEHYIDYQACYWENGKLNYLPVPTEEELGYYILGSRARCVSADGSVIMGNLTDRLYTNPMVLWFRQPDGSYKLDPVCMQYFSDIKYNDGSYKEYVQFRGDAMNQAGTKVAMTVRLSPEYNKPVKDPQTLAIYDIATGSIDRIVIDGQGDIAPETVLNVYYNGIADDGTVVGYYESSWGGVVAFILRGGKGQPRNLASVYGNIGELADFDDIGTNMISSISADGRYLAGMGWTIDNRYDMGYYVGYVLDTYPDGVPDTGVDEILTADDSEAVYFNLQGQKVNHPERGIFVKVVDGKAVKVVR